MMVNSSTNKPSCAACVLLISQINSSIDAVAALGQCLLVMAPLLLFMNSTSLTGLLDIVTLVTWIH